MSELKAKALFLPDLLTFAQIPFSKALSSVQHGPREACCGAKPVYWSMLPMAGVISKSSIAEVNIVALNLIASLKMPKVYTRKLDSS